MGRPFKPRTPHRIPTWSLSGGRGAHALLCCPASLGAPACVPSGGPDVCQALERPAMLTHTRCGRPIEERERVCGEPEVPAFPAPSRARAIRLLSSIRHVHLPALIRSRSGLERLLDHRTRSVSPGPEPSAAAAPDRRLAWQPPRDRRAPPSRAVDARRLSARHWSHTGVVVPCRLSPVLTHAVTIWDVRACEGRCRYSARAATAPAGAAPCRRVPPLVQAPCVPPGDGGLGGTRVKVRPSVPSDS